MSVPLEGLAIHDTSDRVQRARLMAEYRRQAREELKHIRLFQQQQADTALNRPATPESRESTQGAVDPGATASISAFPMPPGYTHQPLAVDDPLPATPSKPTTKTPSKPSTKLKGLFTRTPKKKDRPKDDFADIRKAFTTERLIRPETARSRTADPAEGGQLPGEDSWDWYQRNISALPPMPSLTHPAFRGQDRNEEGR
ncbi:uncharacterized protein N0V89_007565 [Didymosphaeria variabile]|uniref:Uncharacterized protein n=1 Tax=Didymosphaeria variabile TaxID=1932322 RepID=A0A9W8XLD4_9PLEO|nr:uncharacterized protein N0V89_007565 [Didymosphaeria variabile]KAJ4352218.1 hypothetical protein N0V89_007565 [Didymosphaeria variabile]